MEDCLPGRQRSAAWTPFPLPPSVGGAALDLFWYLTHQKGANAAGPVVPRGPAAGRGILT